jgi:hypothetical protein
MTIRRKTRAPARGGGFPVWLFTLLLAAAALCLAYVWGNGRSHSLGVRIKTLERELAEVNKVYAHEQLKWENMKSPPNIDRTLARYNVTMTWPAESAIVRLRDPGGVEGSLAGPQREVAAHALGHPPKGGRP